VASPNLALRGVYYEVVMRRTSLALLAVAASLAGCGRNAPGVYDLTPAEAMQRLQDADVPGFVAARGCAVALNLAIRPDAQNAQRWIIRGEGAELAHFTVRLDDAGPGKVHALVTVPDDSQAGPVQAAPSGATALRRPLLPAAVELVYAALEGRSFDSARIGDDRPQLEACKAAAAAPIAMADPPPVDHRANAFGAPMVNADQAGTKASGSAAPMFGQQFEDTPTSAH